MNSFSIELDYELLVNSELESLDLMSTRKTLQKCRDDEVLKKKYPAKAHARKVAAELGVKEGLIYLDGMPTILLEDSDQPRPFRQRKYFYYLTGANFPDFSVTYEVAEDRLILWVPFIEPRQVLWFGNSPSAAAALQLYDVDDARYESQLSSFLAKHLSSSKVLYVLHKDQLPPGLTTTWMGAIDSSKLQPAMDRARVIKDEYEVALIRRANDISSASHRRIAESLTRLQNEREIEAIFHGVSTARDGKEMAYPVIAGSGTNASTLHYDANDQPLKGKALVVVDAGCEYKCYASDITRTLPISGSWTPRADAIHRIVQKMQDTCIDGVRPGTVFYDLHLLAGRIAVEGLLELGILQGKASEITEAGTIAAFFPHGLGHHVGLEVHDVRGSLPLSVDKDLGLEHGKRELMTPIKYQNLVSMRTASNRAQQERALLRPGMVVTVEPGIYFCRPYLEGYYRDNPTHSKFIDWNVLESYYEVGGVRIEDCILVTKDDPDNLTTAPKGDELLDTIRRGKTL